MKRLPWSGFAVLLAVVTALVLHRAGVLDLRALADWMEAQAAHAWAPWALTALMAALYLFALPASTLMLVAGVMFTPLWATWWSVLGGVVGGLLAYGLARRMPESWAARYRDTAGYRLLQAQAGFTMLCALRIFPGFPHPVLNYGAGLLNLSLIRFVASTAIGFAIKAYVYTSAMHHAVRVEDAALSWRQWWPLLALALLMLGGLGLRYWLKGALIKSRRVASASAGPTA